MINWIKPRRVSLLDEYRGLCILSMVLYHAAYDLVYLFGIDLPGYQSFWMPYYQPLLAGSFILLSGISSLYSRGNVKRGLFTLAMGGVITLITWRFMPSEVIWYGILHFLGTCMLLYPLLRPLLDKLSVFAGMVITAGLFFVTYYIPRGFLVTLQLPVKLYSSPFLMPLGFGGMGSDYFPLLPWLFLFLFGTFLGRMFYQDDMPDTFYRSHCPPLARIGRHTMIIYMVHQPVVYGILWLIFRLTGRI